MKCGSSFTRRRFIAMATAATVLPTADFALGQSSTNPASTPTGPTPALSPPAILLMQS